MISIDLLGLSPIDFLYCFCVSYVVNALVAVDLFASAADWARSTALDSSQPEILRLGIRVIQAKYIDTYQNQYPRTAFRDHRDLQLNTGHMWRPLIFRSAHSCPECGSSRLLSIQTSVFAQAKVTETVEHLNSYTFLVVVLV